MFLKTSYWVRVRSPAAKTEGPRPGEMSSQAHPGHSPCPKYSKRSKLVIVWYSLKLLPRDPMNIKKIIRCIFFWPCHAACVISVPRPGMKLVLLTVKCAALATELLGKSQEYLI